MRRKRFSVFGRWLVLSAILLLAGSVFGYTPPATTRAKYNMNYDWKFIKQDVPAATNPAYDDSAWTNVSVPHTYNDYDFYNTWITGSGHYGWAGKTWYRKHFKLPSTLSGKKVIIEFEDVRQAAEVYINGTWIGRHENGTTAFGFDLTPYLNFGTTENVLAVKVDNTLGYSELSTGVNYVWNTPPFDPNMGGIVNNVNLHVSEKIYQTLPLYGISLNDTVTNGNLGTYGTYIYAQNIDTLNKEADITAQAEVKNETGTSQTVTIEANIVDMNGNNVLTLPGNTTTIANGKISTLAAAGHMTGIHLWAPDYPYVYQVYTIIKVGGTAVDVYATPLGVRKISFNVSQGLKINGRPIYLKGFAPRSTMEWVAVGQAPTWLEEYDFSLMKDCNGNFVRPMHVSAKSIDINAADKFGIIYALPAGDAEGDSSNRQWDQRTELRKDSIIYFRNHPSVVFYEGGNQNLTNFHMQQMKDIAYACDPFGGRLSGTRSSDSMLNGISEYFSSMDNPATSSLLPLWDAEYCRTECPRRVWDIYTGPSFGYKNICDSANTINSYPESGFIYNSSEDLARGNVSDYFDRWSKRGGQGLSSIMVGGAKIIFADSISHGRVANTEVARVSGALDGARLPKETYYAMKACQSDIPSIHIIGHWNYTAGTTKTMVVISSCDQVKLATYNADGSLNKDYGNGVRSNNFEFTFPNVAWVSGKVVATGYTNGVSVVSQQKATAGTPVKLKITPITGPNGFIADGVDIAMFDVEVVDASGNRCPTVESTVNFTYSGVGAVYLGGYNSGIQNSTRQNYLNVECGVNRVFVRSTRTAGSFTLTASGSGLTSGSATINSAAWNLTDGLTTAFPQAYSPALGSEPAAVADLSSSSFSSSSTSSSSSSAGSSQANNLAYLKAVTCSMEQAGNEATNIVDGNNTTRWSGSPWPTWIQVDLGTQAQFDTIELMPFSKRSYQYYIESSTDGLNYNRIVDMTGNTISTNLLRSTFPAVTARYVKMTVTGCANYTGGWSSFYEFRILAAAGADTTPNPFTFTDLTGAGLFGQYTSAPITVSGINAPATIQITGFNEDAYYSINGGAFVQSAGTVNNGDQVRVQLATGSQYSSMYYATLNIGGVSDDFNITTMAAPASSSISSSSSSSIISSSSSSIISSSSSSSSVISSSSSAISSSVSSITTTISKTNWLYNDAVSGVTPAATGDLISTQGTITGMRPTIAIDTTAKYWYSPVLTGSVNAGTWTLVLWSADPTAAFNVTAEIAVTASDGSAASVIGTKTMDVSPGGGNHASTFTISGIAAQNLSGQRIRVKILKDSGTDSSILMIYNSNDFPTRLILP